MTATEKRPAWLATDEELTDYWARRERETEQTIAHTGMTEQELRAWFAGWEDAYFLRAGADEETRRMVAGTRSDATVAQILELWEQTRLEAG